MDTIGEPVLEDRYIKVGDSVQIIVADDYSTHDIIGISEPDIYFSPELNGLSRISPDPEKLRLIGLQTPHHLLFVDREDPESQGMGLITGNPMTDIQILSRVDNQTMCYLCSTNKLINSLCQRDDLWSERVEYQMGKKVMKIKPINMSSKDYYNILTKYPLTVGGANIALVKNDQIPLQTLENIGIYPDIDNIKSRPFSFNIGFDFVKNSRPEFMNFLREADLGPQVAGSFAKRKTPDPSTLITLPNTDLKDILYMIRPAINGQNNPLYSKTTLDNFRNIILLHLFYDSKNRKVEFNPQHLSISPLMRHHLGKLIEMAIDDNLERALEDYPDRTEEIHDQSQLLKDAIYDPNLMANVSADLRLFDPNDFSSSDIFNLWRSSTTGFMTLPSTINEVYTFIPDVSENKVIAIQRDVLILAKNYIEESYL